MRQSVAGPQPKGLPPELQTKTLQKKHDVARLQYSSISLDQSPPLDIVLRFFLSFPLFGILTGLLIFIKGNDLFYSNWDNLTVALTHLITLGCLTMTMIGAFYQMVPVLVGGKVPYIHLSRLVHASFVTGILFLVAGIILFSSIFMAISAILLVLSFAVFISQFSIAVFKVKADRPTIVAMRISIVSLIFTVALGIMFVGEYASWWSYPFDRSIITGIHLTFGLFGWVGSLIMGVGFHVVPMFYLTNPFPNNRANLILILQVISLLSIPICLIAELPVIWLFFAGLPGIAGMLIFIFTTYKIINKRKRKVVDTTIRFWQFGMASLAFSLLALIVYQFFPHEVYLFLFGFLFLAGFAVSIINGMSYKIVPFMVWLHRFSLLIGKPNVPLLKDISPDKNARMQWKIYIGSIFMLLLGIISNMDPIIRAGGLAFLISSTHLFFNLLKAATMKVPAVDVPKNNFAFVEDE